MRLLICQLLLPLLLMLAAARPAAGVTPANSPQPHPIADTTAPPLDTIRVLGQFFAHQRKVSRPLLFSAFTALAFNYALAYSKSETTFQQVGRGILVAEVAFFTYRFGKAVVQLRRYRVEREHTLLATLAHGQPLPRPVRRRLLAYLRPVPAK